MAHTASTVVVDRSAQTTKTILRAIIETAPMVEVETASLNVRRIITIPWTVGSAIWGGSSTGPEKFPIAMYKVPSPCPCRPTTTLETTRATWRVSTKPTTQSQSLLQPLPKAIRNFHLTKTFRHHQPCHSTHPHGHNGGRQQHQTRPRFHP